MAPNSAPSSNRLGAARQSTARGESRASPALRAPQGEQAERGSAGWWSRRIIQDHRLVYRAAASLRSLLRPGNDEGAGAYANHQRWKLAAAGRTAATVHSPFQTQSKNCVEGLGHQG
ncbi:MAG: type II toxin-antitoxin system YoeB family toxin [Mesorhizobium sp.]|nr:MAG: type II toxin-antitoxin system YoeB family toxin [Mesorhizobium sp.]TIL91550.1 MAG: type II toxin-antitoxin system YoeB family toxin [Mesorhizobium sp.]TIL99472.1 MAG: type II toxin-antitoxin system YoeB family toxin [Mesorhizobium sp.]